jgi:alkanesulfonate monooxygenase SsuD/methylene tetrahydromethanopterin reductase-like flavin-dependent oxidoreductase (luciferase family)
VVQAADRLGYDSIWIPETWGDDAVSTLAVLARETERIRVASGVFNVYSRSAALLAQTAATLQELSAGRFVLGLGTSGPRVVERWHGIPFERPIVRTRECVEAIRLAVSGQRVDYQGSTLQLEGFRLANPPGAPVPIYIAALGPRNVRLTGALADGWLPIFMSRSALPALLERLRSGASAAGRPALPDVAAYLPVLISPRGDRLLAQHLAYYIGGMGDFYHDFVSDAVREAWRSGSRLAALDAVDPAMLEACTLGSHTDTARERLEDYRSRGVDLPVLSFPHGATLEDILTTLRALAPVV